MIVLNVRMGSANRLCAQKEVGSRVCGVSSKTPCGYRMMGAAARVPNHHGVSADSKRRKAGCGNSILGRGQACAHTQGLEGACIIQEIANVRGRNRWCAQGIG